MKRRIGWHGDSQDWTLGFPEILMGTEPDGNLSLSLEDGYALLNRAEARTMGELLIHFAEKGTLPDGFVPKP